MDYDDGKTMTCAATCIQKWYRNIQEQSFYRIQLLNPTPKGTLKRNNDNSKAICKHLRYRETLRSSSELQDRAAITIQSWWRMVSFRWQYLAELIEIYRADGFVKPFPCITPPRPSLQPSLHLQDVRADEDSSACCIQAWWRMVVPRINFKMLRLCSFIITDVTKQKMIPQIDEGSIWGHKFQKHLQQRFCASVAIQKKWRMRTVRIAFIAQNLSLRCLQAFFRGHRFRRRFLSIICSVKKIQSFYRRHSSRRLTREIGACNSQPSYCNEFVYRDEHMKFCDASCMIQAWWRIVFTRYKYLNLRNTTCTLNSKICQNMDSRIAREQQVAIVVIQSWIRSFFQHRIYITQRNIVSKIQARVRCFLKMRNFKKLHHNLLLIQKWWRMVSCQFTYLECRKAIISLQSLTRQRLVGINIHKNNSISRIQAWHRSLCCRAFFLLQKKCANKIQASFAAYVIKKRHLKFLFAALRIQTCWRMAFSRVTYRSVGFLSSQSLFHQIELTQNWDAVAQSDVWRGSNIFHRYNLLQRSCVKLQSAYRRYLFHKRVATRLYGSETLAAVRIQRWWNPRFCKKKKICTSLIQGTIRRYLVRRRYLELKMAHFLIQRWWRKKCRLKYLENIRSSNSKIESPQRASYAYDGTVRTQTRLMTSTTGKDYSAQSTCACKIQAAYRGCCSRNKYEFLRGALIIIQTWWRTILCRKGFMKMLDTIDSPQIELRQNKMRNVLLNNDTATQAQMWQIAQQHLSRSESLVSISSIRHWNSAITIQGEWRASIRREDFGIIRICVVMIQSAFRGFLSMNIYQGDRIACVIIQRQFRMLSARRNFVWILKGFHLIQRSWRGYKGRKDATLMLVREKHIETKRETSAVILQSSMRTVLAMNFYQNLGKCIRIIQKTWRGHRARTMALHLKRNLVVIQTYFKICYLRWQFKRRKEAACVLQSIVRSVQAFRYFEYTKKSICMIQCFFRCCEAKKIAALRNQNILKLQSFFRMCIGIQKSVELKMLAKAILIQSYVRMFLEAYQFRRTLQDACLIQSCWRGYRKNKKHFLLLGYVTLVQTHFRMWLLVCRFQFVKKSSIIIQSIFRGYATKINFIRTKKIVILCQAYARMRRPLRHYERVMVSVLRLQFKLNSFLAVKRFKSKRNASLAIQRCFRGHKVRKRIAFLHDNMIICQKFVRRHLSVQLYDQSKRVCKAIVIQSQFRKFLSLKLFKVAYKRAILVQSYWRGYLARTFVTGFRKDIMMIQSFFRMWLSSAVIRKEKELRNLVSLQSNIRMLCLVYGFREKKRAASVIQRMYRARHDRNSFVLIRNSVVVLQVYFRMHLSRNRFLQLKTASTSIQSFARKSEAQNIFNISRKAACCIQLHVRPWIEKILSHSRRNYSAVYIRIIQASYRQYYHRKNYVKLLDATRTIQSFWRESKPRSKGSKNIQSFISIMFIISGFICFSIWQSGIFLKQDTFYYFSVTPSTIGTTPVAPAFDTSFVTTPVTFTSTAGQPFDTQTPGTGNNFGAPDHFEQYDVGSNPLRFENSFFSPFLLFNKSSYIQYVLQTILLAGFLLFLSKLPLLSMKVFACTARNRISRILALIFRSSLCKTTIDLELESRLQRVLSLLLANKKSKLFSVEDCSDTKTYDSQKGTKLGATFLQKCASIIQHAYRYYVYRAKSYKLRRNIASSQPNVPTVIRNDYVRTRNALYVIQRCARSWLNKKKDFGNNTELSPYAYKIQVIYIKYKRRKEFLKKQRAACAIQNFFRKRMKYNGFFSENFPSNFTFDEDSCRFTSKKNQKISKIETISSELKFRNISHFRYYSAVKIQKFWRKTHFVRKDENHILFQFAGVDDRAFFASSIQRWWRSIHCRSGNIGLISSSMQPGVQIVVVLLTLWYEFLLYLFGLWLLVVHVFVSTLDTAAVNAENSALLQSTHVKNEEEKPFEVVYANGNNGNTIYDRESRSKMNAAKSLRNFSSQTSTKDMHSIIIETNEYTGKKTFYSNLCKILMRISLSLGRKCCHLLSKGITRLYAVSSCVVTTAHIWRNILINISLLFAVMLLLQVQWSQISSFYFFDRLIDDARIFFHEKYMGKQKTEIVAHKEFPYSTESSNEKLLEYWLYRNSSIIVLCTTTLTGTATIWLLRRMLVLQSASHRYAASEIFSAMLRWLNSNIDYFSFEKYGTFNIFRSIKNSSKSNPCLKSTMLTDQDIASQRVCKKLSSLQKRVLRLHSHTRTILAMHGCKTRPKASTRTRNEISRSSRVRKYLSILHRNDIILQAIYCAHPSYRRYRKIRVTTKSLAIRSQIRMSRTRFYFKQSRYAVLALQRHNRDHLERCNAIIFREKLITLQAYFRKYLAMHRFFESKKACKIMQCHFRMLLARNTFDLMRRSMYVLQYHIRFWIKRLPSDSKHNCHSNSATIIQALYRAHRNQRSYGKLRNAALRIQTFLREDSQIGGTSIVYTATEGLTEENGVFDFQDEIEDKLDFSKFEEAIEDSNNRGFDSRNSAISSKSSFEMSTKDHNFSNDVMQKKGRKSLKSGNVLNMAPPGWGETGDIPSMPASEITSLVKDNFVSDVAQFEEKSKEFVKYGSNSFDKEIRSEKAFIGMQDKQNITDEITKDPKFSDAIKDSEGNENLKSNNSLSVLPRVWVGVVGSSSGQKYLFSEKENTGIWEKSMSVPELTSPVGNSIASDDIGLENRAKKIVECGSNSFDGHDYFDAKEKLSVVNEITKDHSVPNVLNDFKESKKVQSDDAIGALCATLKNDSRVLSTKFVVVSDVESSTERTEDFLDAAENYLDEQEHVEEIFTSVRETVSANVIVKDFPLVACPAVIVGPHFLKKAPEHSPSEVIKMHGTKFPELDEQQFTELDDEPTSKTHAKSKFKKETVILSTDCRQKNFTYHSSFRFDLITHSACKVQSTFRRFRCVRRYYSYKNAIELLQKTCRAWISRKRKDYAAILIQALYRGYLSKILFEQALMQQIYSSISKVALAEVDSLLSNNQSVVQESCILIQRAVRRIFCSELQQRQQKIQAMEAQSILKRVKQSLCLQGNS